MGKFDDKDTKALLDAFLIQAFASIVQTKEHFEKITTREAGLRMSHGITFAIDQAMLSAENALVSKIVLKMGPQHGHYSEISSAIWNIAAKGFSEGQSPEDTKLSAECFSQLDNIIKIRIKFVHPSYNVSLLENVKEIQIGPVAIREGLSIASNLSKLNDKITFGFDDPPGFQSGNGIQYNVSNTMWEVEVSSSSAARLEYATWLTCIATSLIRLIVEPSQMGSLAPRRADVENQPFDRHRIADEHIVVGESGGFSLGGGKAGRRYELGEEARHALSDEAVRDRIALVFDPPNKSLAQRFSQGLGWLAKGRQAKDRSDRFLFFFTALEALLSSDDKSSPVVQTIARHAAVLWANEIPERIKIAQTIRRLYATRSALVHTGSRSVTYEGANEIHNIAENVFYSVWDTTDLKMSHSTFCERLSKASYGLPYFDD